MRVALFTAKSCLAKCTEAPESMAITCRKLAKEIAVEAHFHSAG